MAPILLSRPQPIRVVSAASLVMIVAWAALTGDLDQLGVLAFPAIVALQTAREWLWRLRVDDAGLVERQGIGPDRELSWDTISGVLMPNSAWWRLNPVIEVDGAPNIQLTAGAHTESVVTLLVRKGKMVDGDATSITAARSLTLWVVVLGLTALLLTAELLSTL